MVESTISAIDTMKHYPGSKLWEFFGFLPDGLYRSIAIKDDPTERAKCSVVRVQFLHVQAVIDNLISTFPSLPLFAAMCILDPQNLPSDTDDLGTYGDDDLDLLLNHFGSPKLDVLPQ